MKDVGLAKLGQSTRKFERYMTDFYLLPLGAVPRLRRPGGLPGPIFIMAHKQACGERADSSMNSRVGHCGGIEQSPQSVRLLAEA